MVVQTHQEALVLVRITVTRILAEDLQNGTTADEIDIDRTFTDDEPDGYGRTDLRYRRLCDLIDDELKRQSLRDFQYTVGFVNSHQAKSISDFIFDTAELLLQAPLAATATTALNWFAGLPKSRKERG